MPFLLWISLAAVIALSALMWLGPLVGGLERMNCQVASYDIAAGRVRHERFVLGLRVSEQVTETVLSSRCRETFGEPPPPRWVFMYSRTPFRVTDGVGGGALWSGEALTMSFARADFTPEAKRQALATYLVLLADGGEPGGRGARFTPAHRYAAEVFNLACRREGQVIEGNMLPAGPAVCSPTSGPAPAANTKGQTHVADSQPGVQ